MHAIPSNPSSPRSPSTIPESKQFPYSDSESDSTRKVAGLSESVLGKERVSPGEKRPLLGAHEPKKIQKTKDSEESEQDPSASDLSSDASDEYEAISSDDASYSEEDSSSEEYNPLATYQNRPLFFPLSILNPLLDGKKSRTATFGEDSGHLPHNSELTCTGEQGMREGSAILKCEDSTLTFSYQNYKPGGSATHTIPGFPDGSSEVTFIFHGTEASRDGEATEITRNAENVIIHKITFTFLNDMREGPATQIRSDGSTENFTYHQDKRVGPATQRWPDGTLLTYSYRNNVRYGNATKVRPNGSIEYFRY